MKIGRRLATKVLNASKFVLGVTGIEDSANTSLEDGLKAAAHVANAAVTEDLDQAMLSALADVVDAATAAFEAYDHTRALEVVETFFWTFTDDYLELIKDRAYAGSAPGEPVDPFAEASGEARSARAALTIALEAFLRLFAPVLPFATEEVWSWWRSGSVHRATWPESNPLREAAAEGSPVSVSGGAELLEAAGDALAALRKIKSEAKVSQRTEITTVELLVPESQVAWVRAAERDLRAAGRVRELTIVSVPDGDGTVITTRGSQLVPAEG
jgi:valyl-tRNA synthetase